MTIGFFYRILCNLNIKSNCRSLSTFKYVHLGNFLKSLKTLAARSFDWLQLEESRSHIKFFYFFYFEANDFRYFGFAFERPPIPEF